MRPMDVLSPAKFVYRLMATLVVFFCALPVSRAEAVEAFFESGGVVSMEAENFHESVANNSGMVWSSSADGSVSGGYYVTTPDTDLSYGSGYKDESAEMKFRIYFETAGTYYIWTRGYGVDGHGDSAHYGLDNADVASGKNAADFWHGQWVWRKVDLPIRNVRSIYIPNEGLYELNVWMREDGFRIDKIVLTTSASTTFADSSFGPAESVQDDVPTPDAVQITSFSVQDKSYLKAGQPITMTIEATNSGTEPREYRVLKGGVALSGCDWSTDNTCDWTPAVGDHGRHTLRAEARNSDTPTSAEDNESADIFVIQTPVTHN